jgi:hypothetical protein
MKASARKSVMPPRVTGTRHNRRRSPTAAHNARRQFLHLAAGAAAHPTLSRFAWAQTYPTRPVCA